MAKTNEYLEKAYETLLKFSADEIRRARYEAREKAIRDHNSFLNAARSEGRLAGRQETKQVFQLHLQGVTDEEIAAKCGISVENVQEILS